MMISRRSFIGGAAGTAGAVAVGGGAWVTLVRHSVSESGASTADRVLVVVEMAGGNDALNTLVPNDGRYRDARPTLAIDEADLLDLVGAEASLHPSLAPLASQWESGTMAAVAGVGMADQSRSHFAAMDSWWSGAPGGGSQSGWLGRWLDATLDGDPDPLRAIALGSSGRSLVAASSLSTVVHSPAAFQLRTFPGVDGDAIVDAFLATAQPLSPLPGLAAAQAAIPAAVDAVDVLDQVSGDGPAAPDATSGGESVADLLLTAAGIIDLGIGTRVITVTVGSFDTHADQADRQGRLLADVADGISTFLDRVGGDGHGDRVMVMTTSEFGRRVAENGSGGTDHGTGGLQFVFGPQVQGGQVFGSYDLGALVQGDLPVVVDTRSVYADMLDWLGGPTEEILDGSHDRLGLIS
jgi:uncharacterized protein (DUF1501 family)